MNEQALTLDQVLVQRRDASQEIVDVDEPSIKLVIFELGGEWFAFPGEVIREILPQVDIFFVPGCPASLELLGLRMDAIYPLPPLVAARNTLTGLRGLATGAEGVMMLVDFRAVSPPAPDGAPTCPTK